MSDSPDSQDDRIENGHVPPRFYWDDSPSSSEEEDMVLIEDFNIDLPASHMYLGKLNTLGGHTLFDDGEVLNLIGLDTNTLVLPDFTLPLIFDDPSDGSIMERFLKQIKVFVLLCLSSSNPRTYFEYGVTMEVIETSVIDGILTLKAKGRQRCKVISEIKPLSGRLKTVSVKILPENILGSPLMDTQLYTLKKRRPFICRDYQELKKLRKYRKYHVAQYTFPDWLYEEYEPSYYVNLLMEGLKKCFEIEFVPKDPLKLSYWFIQNYLLQHEERLQLLKENTLISRLKREMEYLKSNRLITCKRCSQKISEQQYIIVLSKDGMQTNFVNPGGHVYETVTVSWAENFHLLGKASKKFSWFPGYAWTILQCKQCQAHIGWRFTAYAHIPMSFFGLAMSCISVKNEDEGIIIQHSFRSYSGQSDG